MEIIKEISVLVILGVCSLEDIKKRSICLYKLVFFAVAGIICQIIFRQAAAEILKGILPGAALMILSFLSHGNIGSGDGMLLMAVGIFLGAVYTVNIFIYAMFISFGYALYLSIVKKKKKTYEIPFIPFLLTAFLLEMILQSNMQ